MVDRNNQRQMPPTVARDEDLYSQISAGDAAEIVQQKSSSSFIMNFMVWYMRLTLTIDEKRREYVGVFRILNRIWMVLMGGVYLCGIATFCILVGSYLRFPSYIKEYLEKNNVICEDVKIPYIISKVDLYGLHDKEQTYRIEKLSLFSTFSDFLNRRAKNVAIDGIQITLEDNFKKTQNLLKVLPNLNSMAKTASGIRVDSLDVSRATFSIKGQDYVLPIAFTMTGIYGKETNIVSTISVDQPYLKAQGNLSINNTKKGTTWNLSIPYGTVALPGRSGETMNLNLSLTTNNEQINQITGNLELTLNQIRKKFDLNMDRKKGKSFSGSLQLNWSDMTDAKKPVEKANILLGLSDVSIDKDGIIMTNSPVKLDMSAVYGNQVQVQKLSATLPGKFVCKLSDRCVFDVSRDAPTKVVKTRFPFFQSNLESTRAVTFRLKPTQNTFVLFPKEGMISLNLIGENFQLEEETERLNIKKSLTVPKVSLVGQMNIWNQNLSLAVALQNARYEDNIRKVQGANLLIEDVVQPNSTLSLSIDTFTLRDNDLLKSPFALTYLRRDGRSYADISLKGYPVRLLFDGVYDSLDNTLEGTVMIPTVDLASMRDAWPKISALFPEDLRVVSGKSSAYGHISGRMANLKGPVQVAFSDVVVERGNLKLVNLNTNLTLKTIVPFETEDNQRIFVEEIHSSVPLTNLDLTLKLAAQYAQIKNITAQLADVPLYGIETIIPYHDVGTLLYLRNKVPQLTSVVRQLKVPYWKLSGQPTGNILLPLTIKNFEFGIRNATVQFENLVMDYKGPNKNKPDFLGKEDQYTVKTGNLILENGDDKQLRVALVLDGKVEPSGVKKEVRETAKYNPGVWPEIKQKEKKLPKEIEYAVQDTLKKTEMQDIE